MTGHEYAVEGRPNITGVDDFNDTIYKTARRDRLVDLIADYLTDEQTDARTFYEEILHEVNTWIEYHQSNLNRANEFKTLMQGNRTFEIKTSQFLAEDRITNFPGEPIKIGEDPVILGA